MAFVSIPCITAILILDHDANRVAVKYYTPLASVDGPAVHPPIPNSSTSASTISSSSVTSSTSHSVVPDLASQLLFEKKVFNKLHKSGGVLNPPLTQRYEADIVIFENQIILYKIINDLCVYIVSNAAENELLVYSILVTLDESLAALFKQQVSKKNLIDNLDLLLLTIDEIIDTGGMILENDSATIIQRVMLITGQPGTIGGTTGGIGGTGEVPIVEQSFTQALQTAKDQLVKSFR